MSGGRGGACPLAITTPTRNSTANGRPNRKRTCVAPAVPSVVVSSRCVALRTVWLAAAITVNSAHSQLDSGITTLSVMAGLVPAIHVFPSTSKTWMPGTRPGMTTSFVGRLSRSRRLLGRDHVVHVHVGRELPAVSEQVIDDASLLRHGHPALFERNLELIWRDELVPLVGAARQPAQHVLSPHNREREALDGAIERRDHHQAAGLNHFGTAVNEQSEVGDMLDHLHGEHDLEALAGVRQCLCRGGAVVDGKTLAAGVYLGGLDVSLSRIRAHHRGPEPGDRLAEEAPSAADIEHAQPRQAVEPLGITDEPP